MDGNQIEAFEWVKLSLTGACAAYCFLGAVYVVPKLSQSAFNGIWRTRLLVQVTAFLLAVTQLLPLQLWDGKYGAVQLLPAGFNREILCKTFTVAALGVFQPFLLFLAGFLCSHALKDTPSQFSIRRFPVLTAALVMLPFTGGQILSAFWSTWLESTVNENDEIGRLPFSTFSRVPCPGENGIVDLSDLSESSPLPPSDTQIGLQGANSSAAASALSPSPAPVPAGPLDIPISPVPIPAPTLCISCKYTFCSVVTHVVLTVAFAVIIATFGRVMLERCGNRALRHRIRVLCVLLPLLQAMQCAAATVTVVKRHVHTWSHEVSKFIALVCVLALIVAVTTMLVIMPLHAAGYALRLVAKVQLDVERSISGALGGGEDAVLLPAYRTRSGTPGNSAPLLPHSGGDSGSAPVYDNLLGGSRGSSRGGSPTRVPRGSSLSGAPSGGAGLSVSLSGGSFSGAAVAVDDVSRRVEGYTVDRRTQERAAAYAYDDGLAALRGGSARGGSPGGSNPGS